MRGPDYSNKQYIAVLTSEFRCTNILSGKR